MYRIERPCAAATVAKVRRKPCAEMSLPISAERWRMRPATLSLAHGFASSLEHGLAYAEKLGRVLNAQVIGH